MLVLDFVDDLLDAQDTLAIHPQLLDRRLYEILDFVTPRYLLLQLADLVGILLMLFHNPVNKMI